jgi:hypothetical protein
LDNSLDGPLAKTKRARMHLDSLNEVIKLHLDELNCHVIKDTDTNTNEKVWRFDGEALPTSVSTEISLLMGDALYNFRSALDHLVWQLVLVNNGTPDEKNRNAYPIFNPEDKNPEKKWDSPKAKDGLKGVSTEAQAIIKSLQPRRGEDHSLWQGDFALWQLERLCNIDKHRNLHLTVVETDGASFNIHPTPEIWRRMCDGCGVVENGKVLLRIPIDYGDIGFCPIFDIVFAEKETPMFNQPVKRTIKIIADSVDNVLEKFTRFF